MMCLLFSSLTYYSLLTCHIWSNKTRWTRNEWHPLVFGIVHFVLYRCPVNRLKAQSQAKKFQSLKNCFIQAYIIVNIYYLSTPFIWKRYVPDKCLFRNVHTTSDNHDTNSIGFDHKTCRLRVWKEGSMLRCFFLWKGQHWRKLLFSFCYYTSHEHPMNNASVFWRCSRCQAAEFSCVDPFCFNMFGR